MDSYSDFLSELLERTYYSVIQIEEHMVKGAKSLNLSIGEIHLIEAVAKGQEEGKTISELSEMQSISLPSVTLAINKLVKKGYVIKSKSPQDGRVVNVTLTKRGQKVNNVHQHFHKLMIASVTDALSQEELDAMVKGIVKLNEFLEKKAEKVEK